MTRHTAVALVVMGCLGPGAVALGAQEQAEQTLVVGQQEKFEPGYPVGDIAVSDANIADFRVLSGRRAVLLLGKARGTTTLNITDQRRVLRTILTIVVRAREEQQREGDLKELLAEFPGVSVRHLGDALVVTGTVASKADLDAVQKIASAARAQNLVRLSMKSAPSGPAAEETPVVGGATQIEYDVDILEASASFTSGSYATGVEPSGRSLYRQTVRVPVGAETEIFVPGGTVDEDLTKKPTVGIRLKLQPRDLADDGDFTTFVVVETNLPVEQSRDPSVMRRARWELEASLDAPFALAGAQLLAVPAATRSGGSKFGRVVRTAGAITGMPGVRGTGASEYTRGIPYYNRQKQTQLLALFRPRVVRPAR